MALEDIIRYKQIKHVENEKRILTTVQHPFIVKLVSCSVDTRFLYFVLPFIPGGEVFSHLRAVRKFGKVLSPVMIIATIRDYEPVALTPPIIQVKL